MLKIDELYKICKAMIENDKGHYEISLNTGGHYDDNVMYVNIYDDSEELSLSTPN